MLPIFSTAFPLLERVATNADEVVLTVVFGKGSVAVSEATGAAAAVPEPVSEADELLETHCRSR